MMKAQMKRALALLIALLLCSVALAEDDIYRYVVKAGYQPTASQVEVDQNICVYETGANKCAITWTAEGNQYRVTESVEISKLQALYLDLLSQKSWDGAQYLDTSGTALFGYHSGEQTAQDEASSLEEYTQKVTAFIQGSEARNYVLNKNTKRFHHPTCTDVGKIKEKNREEVHETRQKLIDDGYRPCGHCKP